MFYIHQSCTKVSTPLASQSPLPSSESVRLPLNIPIKLYAIYETYMTKLHREFIKLIYIYMYGKPVD